jgi:DNA-binding transcriptional ArsR family regulator
MDIRLDKETFKALASETRVDVLKLLNQRRHMQSEIASSLNLSVPTVKEHLDALEKAGLVERHDEGRKWKYYSLTKKGKGVLNPEELKIWIVLGTFVLGAVGTAWNYFRSSVPQPAVAEMKMAAEASAESFSMMAQAAPAPEPVNYALYVFCSIAVLSIIALVYLIYRNAQYKSQLGKSLIKK